MIEIGDIPFHGYIDRIERTSTGDYEVIDFKTGGEHEKKKSIHDNFQMNVYALAIEKLYGKLPKSTSLFYLKTDKIIVNPIDSVQVKEVKSIIEKIVKSILDEEFKATPSLKTCRTCDYHIICDDKKVK
jgi:CRISPR/Cas system-associated exonuclease Cas4 (RecB family)